MQFRKLDITNGKPFQKVGLISTIPRSSTWATRYSFAALDALLSGSNQADPFSDFSPRLGLNLEMLFVGHFYHPLFDTVVDQAFKSKWDTLHDPLPGANWMSPEIMHFKSERPRLFSKDLPTVFVYREPYSMLRSYFNQVLKSKWFFKHPLRGADGEIWRPSSYSEFVVNGGIQSYVKYRATFEVVSRKRPSAVLFVRYEDILNDRFSCFRKIADFIGCGWVKDGQISNALELTSPDSLKKLENESGCTLSDGDGITEFFVSGSASDPQRIKKSHFTGADASSREMLSKDEVEFCESLLSEYCDF